MGVAAGDGMISFVGWAEKNSALEGSLRYRPGWAGSRDRSSFRGVKRGLNFRDYSRFSRLGFTPRTIWYSTMFLRRVLRLRVAFAINNNLNMKQRNSKVVQLSAIVQLTGLCLVAGPARMGYLRWMPLGGGGAKPEARNRGAKPRREMKSNGSCVLWLIATLQMTP